MGSLVGFAEIFMQFCAICFVSKFDAAHKIRDDEEGSVYRNFHCGKRGFKSANLG